MHSIKIHFSIMFLTCFLLFVSISNLFADDSVSFQKDTVESETHMESSSVGEETAEQEAHHAPHLNGKGLSLWWLIPFVGILLSIAVLPIISPHFWHHHYGKVSLFWGLLFFTMFSVLYGINMSLFYLAEVYLGEFIPFIVLLLALFTIGGGIQLKGKLVGTPLLNTILILIGTILASWMGTTGAAMLMIRPTIRANAWRKNQKHVIIFFIFLVANIGGSLTPLGDPPLFLGFLKGVSFFWTTTHMFLPMLFEIVFLLIVFFALDSWYYKKEENKPDPNEPGEPFAIEGKINFILLLGVIGAVVFSGLWHSNISNPDDWGIVLWHTGLMTKGTLEIGRAHV